LRRAVTSCTCAFSSSFSALRMFEDRAVAHRVFRAHAFEAERGGIDCGLVHCDEVISAPRCH
jgi:hypothetical protein